MALESASFISGLVTSNPVGATDSRRAGDDHIRLLKSTIQATFPGFDEAQAKMRINATSAPGVGDDSADGFAAGSIWIDVTNDKAYICLDASAGAAIWKEWVFSLGVGMACRLKYVGTTEIRLMPFNGNQIFINGERRTLPTAGIALANTGLVAATRYLIYAYWNGTTVVLEASTTAHALDTTYGHRVKNGDVTRILVGQVYMDAGVPGTFANTARKRYVRSWYHRENASFQGYNSAEIGIGYSPWGELSLADIRCNFLSWDDEVLDANGSMSARDDGTASAQFYTALAVDTTSGSNLSLQSTGHVAAIGKYCHMAVRGTAVMTEGFHYVTLVVGIGVGGTPRTPAAYAGIAGVVQ